jgi:hypothetical protein
MSVIRKVQQHNIGTTIRMRLKDQAGEPLDLTDATTVEIWVRKTSGATAVWPAVVSGAPTEGVLEHATIAGDLDEFGRWEIQGHVVVPDGDLHSRRQPLDVEYNIAPPDLVLRPDSVGTYADARSAGTTP